MSWWSSRLRRLGQHFGHRHRGPSALWYWAKAAKHAERDPIRFLSSNRQMNANDPRSFEGYKGQPASNQQDSAGPAPFATTKQRHDKHSQYQPIPRFNAPKALVSSIGLVNVVRVMWVNQLIVDLVSRSSKNRTGTRTRWQWIFWLVTGLQWR